jgi:hypothetical protein
VGKITPGKVTHCNRWSRGSSRADAAGKFAGHVPLDVGLARALEAKYATIDHLDGYVEALAKDPTASQFFGINLINEVDESRIPALIEKTKAAGTWMVPTETCSSTCCAKIAGVMLNGRWMSKADIDKRLESGK